VFVIIFACGCLRWFPSSCLGTRFWKLQLPVTRSWSFVDRIPKQELGNERKPVYIRQFVTLIDKVKALQT